MGRPAHFGGGPVLKGWLESANCYEQGTAIFYSESTKKAKSMCKDCPTKDPCLAEWLREEHGVWGGLTAPERDRYRAELLHYVKNVVLPRYPDGWWSGDDTRGAVAGSGGDETLE